MTQARDLANFISNGLADTAEVADGAITEAKLASASVTDTKVASGITGTKISYDNSVSGISANTMQEAVDYLNALSGGSSGSVASYTRSKFTATAGQTTFAVTYQVGYLEVYLNGVLLDITDYAASDGTSVVLAVGASAGDEIVTIALDSFAIAELLRIFSTSASAPDDSVTVDASGRVGVGEATPSSSLHITENEITAYNGAATDGQLGAGSSLFLRQAGGSNTALSQIVFQPRTGYGYNRIVNSGGSAPYMAFATNNAERARLDASGNLLVGKTAANNTVVGVEAKADGNFSACADGITPALFRRKTSDGAIVEFAKDGTTVGVIRSVSGIDMALGNDTTGLRFYDGSNADGGVGIIVPWNVTANAARDAQMNLGSSTERYRNLYLSGGVYLGGTGAANLLDDYEEGVWTPTINAGFTVAVVNGARYTKIGRLVTIQADFTVTGTGTSDFLYLGGLPFAAANGGGWSTGTGYFQYVNNNYYMQPTTLVRNNEANIVWQINASTGAGTVMQGNNIDAGYIQVSATYQTN